MTQLFYLIFLFVSSTIVKPWREDPWRENPIIACQTVATSVREGVKNEKKKRGEKVRAVAL